MGFAKENDTDRWIYHFTYSYLPPPPASSASSASYIVRSRLDPGFHYVLEENWKSGRKGELLHWPVFVWYSCQVYHNHLHQIFRKTVFELWASMMATEWQQSSVSAGRTSKWRTYCCVRHSRIIPKSLGLNSETMTRFKGWRLRYLFRWKSVPKNSPTDSWLHITYRVTWSQVGELIFEVTWYFACRVYSGIRF